MGILVQDIRFAFRVLAKSPGFTLVAVLCLALGIGANSTIFSLVDGFWMRSLPVRNPGGMVYLFLATEQSRFGQLSYPDYLDFKRDAKTLGGLTVTQRRGPVLTGEGFAESTMSNVVSEDYFTVLGISAQVGRVFSESDRNRDPVVVMSHNLWQRRFGADPGIVGKTVPLGRLYTVIGVAPRGFRGVEPWVDSDFWIPMSSWDSSPEGERTRRRDRSFTAMGRLRPGVSLEQARAEIEGIARNLEREYPEFNKGRRGVLYSALEYKIQSAGYGAGVLVGIVAAVLLIACANVAGLLLARAGMRSREIGVRASMGARRSRLVRQLLTESSLIAVLGAAAGLLLASWMIELLPALVTPPGDTYTKYEFHMDSRVLACTLSISLLAVLAFGVFPALAVSRPDVASVLKGERSDRSRGSGRVGLRSLLVIGQVAVSVILLTAAGLLVRSFLHSLNVNLGFERKNLLVAKVSPDYRPARAREFYRQLLERVRALPGAQQATLAMRPPLWPSEGGTAENIKVPGRLLRPGEAAPQVKYNVVDRNYFRTLGIPLLRGRDFDEHDGPDSPKVMIVSETMARRFWPNEEAVGRFVHVGDDPDGMNRQIAGVVGDARINSIYEAPEAYFYLPHSQSNRRMMLLAGAADDPLRLADQVRAEVAALDSRVPVLTVSTLGLVIRSNTYERQTSAVVVGTLGVMGWLLASIGLYGVIAYTAMQRTREIGIGMALGAQRREALRLVLWRGVRLAAIGIAVAASYLPARRAGEGGSHHGPAVRLNFFS